MPDYSILPTLCDKFNISITELLSGEKLDENQYQKKLEEGFILNMALLKSKVKIMVRLLVIGIIILICLVILLFIK